MQTIQVRFAELKDLAFVSQDHFITKDIVTRKIDWQEVFLAELGDQPV